MSESEKWERMLKAMASVLPADPYAPITREMVQEAMRRAQAATRDDLDAHLADEFPDEQMDPLGATLTEEEQHERFAGYGRGGEEE